MQWTEMRPQDFDTAESLTLFDVTPEMRPGASGPDAMGTPDMFAEFAEGDAVESVETGDKGRVTLVGKRGNMRVTFWRNGKLHNVATHADFLRRASDGKAEVTK